VGCFGGGFCQVEGVSLAGIERQANGVVAGWGRDGEWLAWAGATKEAIERCRVPLEDAGVALVVC
jgi:hypothetical protein